MINLDERYDIGTHWIALYINAKTITYFDSFWGSTYFKRNQKIY